MPVEYKWDNNSVFVPVTTPGASDYVMGLKSDASQNQKYTVTNLLAAYAKSPTTSAQYAIPVVATANGQQLSDSGWTINLGSKQMTGIGLLTAPLYITQSDTDSTATLVNNQEHLFTTAASTITYALPASSFNGDTIIVSTNKSDNTFVINTTSGFNILCNGIAVNGSASTVIWKVISMVGNFTIDTTGAAGGFGKITSSSAMASLTMRCEIGNA